ncbi:39S ribosomal protein L18, mitochondrial, partial [Tachysurus ichikawai]
MAAVRGVYRSVRLLLGQKHTETRSCNITVRSWSGAAADPAPEINQNEDVNQTFVNRNPRNLEQMSIAVKDRGWSTIWPKREYYH